MDIKLIKDIKNKSTQGQFDFFKHKKKKSNARNMTINIMVATLLFLSLDFFLNTYPSIAQWDAKFETHAIYQENENLNYEKLNEEIIKSNFEIKDLNSILVHSNFNSSSLQLAKTIAAIKENQFIDNKIKKEAMITYNNNYLNGYNMQKKLLTAPKCSFISITCNLIFNGVKKELKQFDDKALAQIENNKKIINNESKESFDKILNEKIINENNLKN